MFISSALVVDVGGVLSHAAVVALPIPWVLDTGNGTRTLRTGDWVRVDGTAGTGRGARPRSRLSCLVRLQLVQVSVLDAHGE